jgi:predicted nucleic acid-binding protein
MLLLDTNVLSELRKVQSGKADPYVAEWADGVRLLNPWTA